MPMQQVRKKRPLVATCTEGSKGKRRCVKQQLSLFGPPITVYCGDAAALWSCYFSLRHYGTPVPASPLPQFLDEIHSLPARTWLVAEMMNAQLDNYILQYTGIRVLAESGPKILGAQLFVERLLNAMKTHMDLPCIHFEACRALLQWIKPDKDVLHKVCENILMLIESLNYHSSSLQLRYIILDILRYLIGCSKEELQKIACEVKVISSILRLLKDNISDLSTQQIGISIFSWAIEEKPSRDVLVNDGGVALLLKNMRIHAWDETVQCNATATLSWLIHTSDSSSSILHVTDLSTVFDTMKRFLNNPMVFGNSLCVLSGALSSHHRQETFDLSSIEVANFVLLGMETHPHSPKVHRNGLNLLRILIADGNERDEAISTVLEKISVIGNSMKLHPEDTAIQADSCEILAHIASQSEKASAVIKQSGCLEAVYQCQLKHRCNLRAQHNALWFHSCLLRDQRNGVETAFGGGLQVLGTMTRGIVPPDPNHAED